MHDSALCLMWWHQRKIHCHGVGILAVTIQETIIYAVDFTDKNKVYLTTHFHSRHTLQSFTFHYENITLFQSVVFWVVTSYSLWNVGNHLYDYIAPQSRRTIWNLTAVNISNLINFFVSTLAGLKKKSRQLWVKAI